MFTRRQVLTGGAATLATQPFVGFRATGAQVPPPRVRRDVTRMDVRDPFFSKYAEAISRMHDLPDDNPRSWRSQAIIHADHCLHGRPGFLEWHRFYTTYFEQICGGIIGDPSFTLPYWDWSNNDGLLPEPFFGDNPLNVEYWDDPSNYDAPPPWGRIETVGTRDLSAAKGLHSNPVFSDIFAEQNIESIRKLTSYRLFYRRLEDGPHGSAHLLTGGSNGHMIYGLSPLDPVFWLHHCNVDRIWAEWQAAENITPPNAARYVDQFVDQSGESVTVVANESHDHIAMGFTYDSILAANLTLLDVEDVVPDESVADRFARSRSSETPNEALVGRMENDERSVVDIATNLRVPTPNLVAELSGSRVFRATRLLDSPRSAMEPNRFVAELKGVSLPAQEHRSIIVNVFLDCPYLTSQTPSTDRHYAGAFSFFGHTMNMQGGTEFIVDLTNPLRFLAEEGRLRPDELNVQLMPLTLTEGDQTGAEFTVSLVEIHRV